MATTKIWSIHGRLSTVLKYVADHSKTWNGAYKSAAKFHKIDEDKTLKNVLQYTAEQMKTEQQLFVSGINCSPDTNTAEKQFKSTKETFNKKDGIICFHAYQSFKKGEGTGTIAHEIGVKFAREMWGDRFEVLISTHCNTETLHNHFCINSVSFKDGLRYYDQKASYQRMRDLSDKICREYGLSVG